MKKNFKSEDEEVHVSIQAEIKQIDTIIAKIEKNCVSVEDDFFVTFTFSENETYSLDVEPIQMLDFLARMKKVYSRAYSIIKENRLQHKPPQ